MRVHATRNTDKDYPCVQCGSPSTNIIREGDDPRLKCNNCNFLFNASESLAAKEADAIPEGMPELQKPQLVKNDREPNTQEVKDRVEEKLDQDTQNIPAFQEVRIPRTPTFVFMSKNRKLVEFYTQRDLKKAVLRWEGLGVTYNCYQLTPKKVEAKVDIT